MAIRLDAAADRILWTSSLLDRDANYSIAFFFRGTLPTGAGVYTTLFTINENNGSGSYDLWDVNGDGTWARLIAAVATTYSEQRGTTNLSSNTWYYFAGVRSASGTRTGYITPIATPISGSELVLSATPAALTETRMELGGFGSGNVDVFDGRFAGIKIWNAALSLAEIQAEQWTIRPQRYANLVRWLPCLNGSGERAKDYAGILDATESGTLTDEDMPPVAWGGHPLFPQFVSTTPTLEQEGFRSRNNDGDEDAATWRQNQDVADTIGKEVPFRLRALINANNDPTSKNFQIEYRVNGSSDPWSKV